ncbi:thioredoxin family protein [Sinisalibacter lacisalsi]|nr:thioredoxin family protein [Sinisalibacter lacisalsi]
MRNVIGALILGLSTFSSPAAAGELRLLMFEQEGCIWCARWEREIGVAYPNTEQAARAPLTRFDLRDKLPDDISLVRRAHITPTFVLLSDGAEVGRIEGHPGGDFFWFLLDELIKKTTGTPAEN